MNKFEENIKQSLENFEVSYDPKAWEKLSKKLDQIENKSTSKPKKGFNNFLFFGATTLIVAGIYLISNQKNATLPKATNKSTFVEKNTPENTNQTISETASETKKTKLSFITEKTKKQATNEDITPTIQQKTQLKIEKRNQSTTRHILKLTIQKLLFLKI